MARPQTNKITYFPHSVTHGKKMSYIEKKHGNNGYAVWFKILEELGNTDFHYLDLSDEIQVMFLSDRCLVSEDELLIIINDLVKLKEFNTSLWVDNKILFSVKFIDSIQDAYKKRTNECINEKGLHLLLEGLGILKPLKSNLKLVKSKNNTPLNPQSKVKYNKEEYTKEESFDVFWNLYNKKTGKDKVSKKFLSLSINEIELILKAIPIYVESTPDKKYRKDPYTYLNGKHWNDEVQTKSDNNQVSPEFAFLNNPKYKKK